MIQTTPLRDRFLNNLEAQIKSGSTYWLVLGGAFLTLVSNWPGLKDALDAIPILHGYGLPLSLMLGAIVQKLVPSNITTSSSQAQLVELGRLKFNEWARSKGLEEVPPDPAVQAKLPVIPIVAPTSATPATDPMGTAVAPVAAAPAPVAAPIAPPAAAPAQPAPLTSVDLDPTTAVGKQVDPRLLLSLIAEYLKANPPAPRA